MMEFVIDRSKWCRGTPVEEQVRLLRPSDGMMCCLGFYSLACGLKPDDIRDIREPQEVFSEHPVLAAIAPPGMLFLANACEIEDDGDEGEEVVRTEWRATQAAYELMSANDDVSITETEREALIAALFEKQGVTVRFVDSATDKRSVPR